MNLSAAMSGAIVMAYGVAALFFFKFWRRTADPLFVAFAAAFVLLAATALLVLALEVPREEQSPFFLLRLAAFSLIILAIIRKSRRRG